MRTSGCNQWSNGLQNNLTCDLISNFNENIFIETKHTENIKENVARTEQGYSSDNDDDNDNNNYNADCIINTWRLGPRPMTLSGYVYYWNCLTMCPVFLCV